MSNAVFGYGSLILPTSHFLRFDEELKEKRKEILEDDSENKSDRYRDLCLSNRAMERLEESQIEFIPAKISEFERYYALERNEKGNQLVAKETGNEDDFINGVIALNIGDKEFEQVSETEEGYRTARVDRERYETYLSDEKLEERNVELPEEVIMFVEDGEKPEIDFETGQGKNPGYHQHLIKGTELIADIWYDKPRQRQEFIDEFQQDLAETTYERVDGEWKTLAELDR